MNNNKEEKVTKKCSICEKDTTYDLYGNGECHNCGWYNNRLAEENNDRVIAPNFISLNKAKILFKKNIQFKPNFDDFIGMYEFYGEVEFIYKGIQYGLMGDQQGLVEFAWSPNDCQLYKTNEEFKNNARVHDGKLLKDVWDEVEDAKYM